MAIQKGKDKLKGKMGNTVYYKTRRYGYVAREIGYVPKEVRDEAPSFEKARKNNTDFGYSSKVGKLLRNGVKEHFGDVGSGVTNTNLASRIKKALAADTDNPHGSKRLTSENIDLLTGFNWAEKLTLKQVLIKDYDIELNGAEGTASLSIESMVPRSHVKVETNATHVKVRLILVAANYDKDKHLSACAESEMIELSGDEPISIKLTCSLKEHLDGVMVAGIGVQGYQLVNRRMHALLERCVFEIGDSWAE
jgi:hypothetical protein